MARITVEYTKFSNSKLATFFSYLGGLLRSLCMLPGILLLAGAVVDLLFGGFSNGETWSMLVLALVVEACGLGIGFALWFVFDKVAWAIAGQNAGKR